MCSGLETDPFMPLHNFPGMSYRMLRHWCYGVLSYWLLLFWEKVYNSESHLSFKINIFSDYKEMHVLSSSIQIIHIIKLKIKITNTTTSSGLF